MKIFQKYYAYIEDYRRTEAQFHVFESSLFRYALERIWELVWYKKKYSDPISSERNFSLLPHGQGGNNACKNVDNCISMKTMKGYDWKKSK